VQVGGSDDGTYVEVSHEDAPATRALRWKADRAASTADNQLALRAHAGAAAAAESASPAQRFSREQVAEAMTVLGNDTLTRCGAMRRKCIVLSSCAACAHLAGAALTARRLCSAAARAASPGAGAASRGSSVASGTEAGAELLMRAADASMHEAHTQAEHVHAMRGFAARVASDPEMQQRFTQLYASWLAARDSHEVPGIEAGGDVLQARAPAAAAASSGCLVKASSASY
jgi:hypothetical protein